jgi:hypothetical protein
VAPLSCSSALVSAFPATVIDLASRRLAAGRSPTPAAGRRPRATSVTSTAVTAGNVEIRPSAASRPTRTTTSTAPTAAITLLQPLPVPRVAARASTDVTIP